MIQWTTPTLNCTIPSDVTGDYILLTLSTECGKKVERKIDFADIVDGKFTVVLTQEETAFFKEGSTVSAQINLIEDNLRLASNILQLRVTRNLHDEVI